MHQVAFTQVQLLTSKKISSSAAATIFSTTLKFNRLFFVGVMMENDSSHRAEELKQKGNECIKGKLS